MRTLYNILSHVTYAHLQVAKGFSKKLKLFVHGRKESFDRLSSVISATDQTLWMHCASLGEFEQGVPILEELKKNYPNFKIVVTFFSPSGYEIKKDSPLADIVAYLPFDTIHNVKKFMSIVHPSLALFVKYEIWPNYLLELQAKNIPALLVSGVFREKQIFFKVHGGFMRKALRTIHHFFVQNEASKVILEKLDIKNTTVSGDTRFDRVSHQIEMDNSLDFMADFVANSLCVVCGSTWPEDEAILLDYINSQPKGVKFVIAPHKIENSKIESFRNKLISKTILYSELNTNSSLKEDIALSHASVFIVDTIGYLTKIYSYADVAYVGGAASNTGLHNILEPATFGVPILIGTNYEGFSEAKKLRSLAGLYSVGTSEECSTILNKLLSDEKFRTKTGMISGHFINKNTGATKIIMDYIKQMHLNA
ncbi:MAG: 3-deoxy-D-manno-octulosonic acid transferase [Flavobacteriaceae bacterium]|nr:3-deoxy-D-manno-octulosonic acid transferase [Flavobacteriaceae bacterium]